MDTDHHAYTFIRIQSAQVNIKNGEAKRKAGKGERKNNEREIEKVRRKTEMETKVKRGGEARMRRQWMRIKQIERENERKREREEGERKEFCPNLQ